MARFGSTNKCLITVVAWVVTFLQVSVARGQATPSATRSIFFERTIRTDFLPEQVFFLLSREDGIFERVEATVNPPFTQGSRGEFSQGPRSWKAGVRVSVPLSLGEVEYSVLVVGKGNQFELISPRQVAIEAPELFGGSIDALREHLTKRKQDARSWQTQVSAQDDSLRRLRADADLIADLGRIVEVREDIERKKQFIVGLGQDQANLREFIRLARTQASPRNFATRELQLTRQLSELVDLAKSTETGEFTRRSDTEREVQRRLALIEATRGIDVDELQREIIQLRKRRLDLERSSTDLPTEESPEDYLR